jgi:hypothetical protein
MEGANASNRTINITNVQLLETVPDPCRHGKLRRPQSRNSTVFERLELRWPSGRC